MLYLMDLHTIYCIVLCCFLLPYIIMACTLYIVIKVERLLASKKKKTVIDLSGA